MAGKILHCAQRGGVAHAGVDRGALRLGPQQPGRGDKSVRMKSMGLKILPRLVDQAQRLVIPEIVELAFIRRINARDEFGLRRFVRPPGALVEETVDHDLMSPRLQFLQPGAEIGIGQRAPLAVIIGHDEERAGLDPSRARCARMRSVFSRVAGATS